jgi:AAA domain
LADQLDLCRLPLGGDRPEAVPSPNFWKGQMTEATNQTPPWRQLFKTPKQMEIKAQDEMLITGLLPYGNTFFGGLPGHGKSYLSLCIARSLVLGTSVMGHFRVPRKHNVIYLTPEVGESSLKKRLNTLRIGEHDEGLLIRTLSDGELRLVDTRLHEAVKELKPVIFLDTMARFNKVKDENQAAEFIAGFAEQIFKLRELGAEAIISLHHANKVTSESGSRITLENTLRGTSDIGAIADCVYNVNCTDMTHFITKVTCVKMRDEEVLEEFEFRGRPHLDRDGDLFLLRAPGVSTEELEEQRLTLIENLLTLNPAATWGEITSTLKLRRDNCLALLNRNGWYKGRGKHGVWHKSSE